MARAIDSINFYSRLETLRKKHRKLDQQIDQEQKSPVVANYYLGQLKREKLLVKDEMSHVLQQLDGTPANLN